MTKHSVPLTEIIAQRCLSVVGSTEQFKISIYKPQLDHDGKTWGCPFQIEFQENSIIDYAWGVDSFQPLQLVGQGIKLKIRERYPNIQFSENLEDSFPDYIPYYVNEEFRARIVNFIETETVAWNKQLEEKHRGGLA